MRRQTWLLVGGAVVVVAMLGALLRQPPIAAPQATNLATVPILPTVASIPALTPPVTSPAATPLPAVTLAPLTPVGAGRIELGAGLAITLTTGWQGAPYPAPAALGFADPNGTPLLAAWQGAATFLAAPARMTLIRVPRVGISLPAYLDGLTAALATATGVVVTGQQITTSLRSDGLPAGVISYTDNANAPPLHGQQAILIDDSGEHLYLLTLIAAADQAAADEQLRAAVASITFGE